MAGRIREEDLLKHLNELEETVEKGDALLAQNTEGGFSTEGTPLSKKSKIDAAAKAMSASDTDSDEDSDDASSDEGGEAEGGEDTEKCGAKKSEYDDADDDASTMKSFRERADEDETMRKSIEVSDFIEATVDNLDASLKELDQSLRSTLGSEIAKSVAAQSNFNQRLAKAVVSIGNEMREVCDLVKAIANQPNIPQRKSVLSKSEIVEPQLGGMSASDILPSREAMQGWLIEKAQAGIIDAVKVTEFEQSGYDIGVLPMQMRKALVSDLSK